MKLSGELELVCREEFRAESSREQLRASRDRWERDYVKASVAGAGCRAWCGEKVEVPANNVSFLVTMLFFIPFLNDQRGINGSFGNAS